MEIIQGAMEYEDMNIVLRTEKIKREKERERERERESERDLSIYSSMGDYPHVGCHLTSPIAFQTPVTVIAPTTLERIGPGANIWARYTKMDKTQFIEW
jgi:hypothetical protein